MKLSIPLLGACLLAGSTGVFAQQRVDCSKAKDPARCEERVAKMKAARSQAQKACEGKQGDARRDCMRKQMCAQAKDPGRCEAEGRVFTREDLRQAIIAGAVERVRPKMMTVAAIIAGLLPILWASGTGAELMQRIAVPMIGGMVSSTVLTLIVIPAVYGLVKGWRLQPARRGSPMRIDRAAE